MTTTAPAGVTLEEGLADYLALHGWTVTRTGTDLQDRIRDHGAVIRVRRMGGDSQRWQLIARVGVEVFAATYDKAWAVASAVDAALLASPYNAGGWLVDRGVSESAPAEQFYDPSVRLIASAYRVTTRTRPA
jgi:hypothetical protein